MNILPTARIEINEEIDEDVELFIQRIAEEKVDLKNIGIRKYSLTDLLERIRAIYQKNEGKDTR